MFSEASVSHSVHGGFCLLPLRGRSASRGGVCIWGGDPQVCIQAVCPLDLVVAAAAVSTHPTGMNSTGMHSCLTRIHSNRMLTAHSLSYRGSP